MPDQFCEDCGLPSDLGAKCRPCYAKWSRRLWADIPRHLALLGQVSRELNQLDEATRKAVAALGLGKDADIPLRGRSAELLAGVKRCLEGPYGEQLTAKLQAILNATEVAETKRGRKHGGAAEVD